MAAKILVMDDDELMRELLRIHLSHAGYDVMLAEDAVVGGRAAIKDPPDLILADIEMPYLDGLEFLRAFKSDAALASIPVILVSSRSDIEHLGKELGAVAFFPKPVTADRLLAGIAEQLAVARSRPST